MDASQMSKGAGGSEWSGYTVGGTAAVERLSPGGGQTAEVDRFQPILAEDHLRNQGCQTMSTFYVLPPRPLLAKRYAEFLKPLFPDLDWSRWSWAELADAVTGLAGSQPGVYVVFREDLPEGEEPGRALIDGFGAETGDEVIEVRAGVPQEMARRWVVG